MEMINIFVNLDGVIADFYGHADSTGKHLVDGKRDWPNIGRDWWKEIPTIH